MFLNQTTVFCALTVYYRVGAQWWWITGNRLNYSWATSTGAAMRSRNQVAILLAAALGLAACQTGMQPLNSQTNPASPDSCTFDSECVSGNCEFGKCSPFMKPNGCRFDSDCARLEQCLGDSCSKKPGACDFDSDCSYGEECRASTCSQKLNGCNWDSDCASGSCIAGSCM